MCLSVAKQLHVLKKSEKEEEDWQRMTGRREKCFECGRETVLERGMTLNRREEENRRKINDENKNLTGAVRRLDRNGSSIVVWLMFSLFSINISVVSMGGQH